MRRTAAALLSLTLILALGHAPGRADEPRVSVEELLKTRPRSPKTVGRILLIDPTGGPARHLILILDDQVFDITTTPLSPAPTPGPGPAPTPGPLPDGRFGLAPFVRDAAAKVEQPADRRAAAAGALAAAYRAVASQGAAGALATPEALLDATRERVRQGLGANLDAWKPMLDALATQLGALTREGKLAGVADFADAWLEVADGLDALKGGR